MDLTPQLFYYGLDKIPDEALGKPGTYYRNILTDEVWGPKTKEGWPTESLGKQPTRRDLPPEEPT